MSSKQPQVVIDPWTLAVLRRKIACEGDF
jgi:hypothetical protein